MYRWLASFVLLVSMACPARSEVIEVFGADDYPGICFLQDGQAAGVFPQILKGVSKFSGDTYDLKLLSWKRAQSYAAMGKGGVAHFSKTVEREKQFDYSNPVYGDRIQLLVLKGREFPYQKFQDLKGKRIGAKFGASYGQKVDSFFASKEVEIEYDSGINSRLNKLLRNRIDVAIVEGADGNIEKIIGHDAELMQSREQFQFLSVPLEDDALYLAFSKSMNRKDALDRFNAGLEKFRATDAYRQLVRH